MPNPNVTLIAPSSMFGAQFITRDGTTYTVGPTGIITINSMYVQDALNAGFLFAAEGPAVNAITAFAGGGQTSATPLTGIFNRISVCATAGDSVLLPTSAAGMSIIVENDGATALDIFPRTGEFIGTQAVNLAMRIPAGSVVIMNCFVAGTWQPFMTIIPSVKWSQDTTAGAATAAAGALSGAAECIVNITLVGAAAYTTRTVAQMIADSGLRIGQSWKVTIVNTNAGTTTLTGGTNVTITGTATIAQNISRTYVVTVVSATSIVFQECYSGAQ